jgi:hypothetical protein
VPLKGLGRLKKSNDLTGIRTRNLPACSIVPQPTTLPRAPSLVFDPCVETGSNTSTVALRVVGGDEKGTQCLGV